MIIFFGVTTYIANATSLIDGTSIYSLLGLIIDKHTIVNKFNTILNNWFDIQFMIIDEMSMVSCTIFNIMHLNFKKLKSRSK
jgi:hypothetical protein